MQTDLVTYSLLASLIIILFMSYKIYFKFIYPIIQFFKKKNSNGYILNKFGELEHRAVAEVKLERKLEYGEIVHHIDGKIWNNRIKNLAVMNAQEHIRWHNTLEIMYRKKIFPSISRQKKTLKADYGAILL